jgi:hypothetical protein
MALLYADEDFDYTVVDQLRRMGHDVLTVQEAGRGGGADSQVLADATSDHRAVLKFNRWDFERLHRQNSAHAGIISCTRDDDADALAARIDAAIVAGGALPSQHIRVNLPATP